MLGGPRQRGHLGIRASSLGEKLALFRQGRTRAEEHVMPMLGPFDTQYGADAAGSENANPHPCVPFPGKYDALSTSLALYQAACHEDSVTGTRRERRDE